MFDWDEHNIDHIARHGVERDEAEEALLDPRRVGFSAYHVAGERRRAAVGSTELGQVLFLVFTYRRGVIRVVTARDADPIERRRYRRARGRR